MKKILPFVIALATFSCTSNAQKISFSDIALSESLLNTNSKQIAFKEILNKSKGKITVIEVWASWCSDCLKAMPKVKELQANHPDVVFTFISMDKKSEKWLASIKKHELKGEHYMANDQMNGVFGQAIDLDWIPRYIILDKTGKIVLYRAIEKDFDLIHETLNKLK